MPKSVNLRFGEGGITFQVPPKTQFLKPGEPENRVNLEGLGLRLSSLLPAPLPSGRVAIVVADKTRLCSYQTILPWLIDFLLSLGIAKDQLCFYISDGQVVDYSCGASYTDFLEACALHDQHFRLPCESQYSMVIASAGGFPKDINFIQSHKAINNAAGFVKDGGQLIVLAQCPDGIGSSTFIPYFTMGAQEAYAVLVKSYTGNGGTALSMMAKKKNGYAYG